MKKIKLLLIVMVIAVIVSGGIFIHKNQIEKGKKSTEIVEKTKDKDDEVQESTENVEKEEIIDDSVELNDEGQQDVVETKEESTSKNNNTSSTTSTSDSKNNNTTTKKQESSSSSTTTKKQESTTNQNSNSSSNSSSQSSNKNESTKKNAWDELGISEDDYYNSPMLKWQKVTHSSFEKCQEEGEAKIADSSSGFEQYWCYEVYSYSGRKLGIMLKLS